MKDTDASCAAKKGDPADDKVINHPFMEGDKEKDSVTLYFEKAGIGMQVARDALISRRPSIAVIDKKGIFDIMSPMVDLVQVQSTEADASMMIGGEGKLFTIRINEGPLLFRKNALVAADEHISFDVPTDKAFANIPINEAGRLIRAVSDNTTSRIVFRGQGGIKYDFVDHDCSVYVDIRHVVAFSQTVSFIDACKNMYKFTGPGMVLYQTRKFNWSAYQQVCHGPDYSDSGGYCSVHPLFRVIGLVLYVIIMFIMFLIVAVLIMYRK